MHWVAPPHPIGACPPMAERMSRPGMGGLYSGKGAPRSGAGDKGGLQDAADRIQVLVSRGCRRKAVRSPGSASRGHSAGNREGIRGTPSVRGKDDGLRGLLFGGAGKWRGARTHVRADRYARAEPGAQPRTAGLAGTADVICRQDESRAAAHCSFPWGVGPIRRLAAFTFRGAGVVFRGSLGSRGLSFQ